MKQYLHNDNESHHFLLHDCIANKASFEDGVLTFYFPDGIWVLTEHPENTLGQIYQSDAAQVDYHLLCDDPFDAQIFTFTRTFFGRDMCREWKLADFMKALNRRDFELVFVRQYESYQSVLHKNAIYFRNANRRAQLCEIEISTDKVTYRWNKLREDAPYVPD